MPARSPACLSVTRALRLFLLFLLVMPVATAATALELKIRTDHPGSSASHQFRLPLNPGCAYDFTVFWGDATSQVVTTTSSPMHTYAAAGTYTIQIIENVTGGFPAIFFNDAGDKLKLLELSRWGDVTWSTMHRAFHGCSNMRITATDAATARTGGVSDFAFAWSGCGGLTSFPLIDTAAGTDFSSAWYACAGLTNFPLINTAAGTNFNFAWTGCGGLTSFPLIDTASGLVYNATWSGCAGLTSFPRINTAAGRVFNFAWSGCIGLTDFPTLNLGSMTDGTNCFSGNVKFSSGSYSDLLIALAAQNLRSGVTFGGSFSRYNAGAASSRSTLTGTRNWTITDGGQLILPIVSWPAPSGITYGTALSTTQLNATANVHGTFAYNPASGTVLNPGSHTLTTTFTASNTADYESATASVVLSVAKAPLTVTADPKSRAYAVANPGLTASVTGFVHGETLGTSGVTGTPSLSTTASSASAGGAYPIVTAIGTLASGKYRFVLVNGTLTITPVPLTVTASNATRVYGAANPAFAATFTGLVNGDTGASVGGTLVFTTAAAASGVGSYAIVPSGIGTTSYTITYVNGSMTVTRAALTITADDKSRSLNTANPTLTASFAGFVNGDTAASLATPVSLSTTATTASPVGTYPITASAATSPNYTITFVGGTLTVDLSTPSIGTPPGSKGRCGLGSGLGLLGLMLVLAFARRIAWREC